MHQIQEAVRQFMTGGGQSVDRFNPNQATLYVGLQLEEMSEKIAAIAGGGVTDGERDHLMSFSRHLSQWANAFKNGHFMGAVGRANHADLIDADFDLAFVALGGLYSTAKYGLAAVAEGCSSNLGKLTNGVAIRDANGKIQKPAGWTPPNFAQFIDPDAKD